MPKIATSKYRRKSSISSSLVAQAIKKKNWDRASREITDSFPFTPLDAGIIKHAVLFCGDQPPQEKFLKLLLRRVPERFREEAFGEGKAALDSMSPPIVKKFLSKPLKGYLEEYEEVHSRLDVALKVIACELR